MSVNTINFSLMTPVAFVCYFFAPHNDAGTFRSVKFVERMPQHGIDPVVITTDEDSVKTYGGRIDLSIGASIPSSVKILRIPDQRPVFKRWSGLKLYRLLWMFRHKRYLDVYAEWARAVRDFLEPKIRNREIQIVYVSCAPVSPAYELMQLRRRYEFKLVVDFRDPYTDAYGHVFPGKYGWRQARKAEKELIMGVDELIVNTNEVKKVLVERYPTAADKITVITNGY